MDSYKDNMKNVALYEVYNFIAHHIFIWSRFNTEKMLQCFESINIKSSKATKTWKKYQYYLREREREREYHNGDPISYKPHKGLNGFENKSTL